jgi:hypothetical protein
MAKGSMIIPNADLSFARETLRDFIDALALSRAIHAHERHGYALTIAQRCAYDRAVTAWAILFGSDHEEHQQLHWKHMFDVDAFRDGLLAATGDTRDQWRNYWNTLLDYRNELAAHRDLNPNAKVHPNLDKALIAADFYAGRLEEKIRAETGIGAGITNLTEQYDDRHQLCLRQVAVMVEALRLNE